MASGGGGAGASSSSFERSKTMSVTVGDPDEEESGDDGEAIPIANLQEHFRQMAFEEDSFSPAIFVEDRDVIGPAATGTPSTSQATSDLHHQQRFLNDGGEDLCAAAALANVFGEENRLFQPITAGTFIEETVVEKPPKVVNGYLFGQTLGEGSYSKVKEVIETRTLRRRSIKIIKDKRLRKIPNGQKNVDHEIYILKKIRHQNVIQLYDVFRVEDKQKLYIVMDFCVCSLQQLIDGSEEKRLPEFQCHGYFVQLMDGIDYLHRSGVIHKDIKPGNLLLSSDSCLKICDMGVAELLAVPDPLVNDWCTVSQGTPKFQAPELVSGTVDRFRGRPVDVWAAGVTLFNMISGEYPFDGDSLMKLFENITHQPITWPTNVEIRPSLKTFLGNVLDKEPEKRWTSTAIRASEWFNSSFDLRLELLVEAPGVTTDHASLAWPPLMSGRGGGGGDGEGAASDDPVVRWGDDNENLSLSDARRQRRRSSSRDNGKAATAAASENRRRDGIVTRVWRLLRRQCPWWERRRRRRNGDDDATSL